MRIRSGFIRMYNINDNNNKSYAVAENTIRTTNVNIIYILGRYILCIYIYMILNWTHGSKYYGKLVVDESFERVNFEPNPSE